MLPADQGGVVDSQLKACVSFSDQDATTNYSFRFMGQKISGSRMQGSFQWYVLYFEQSCDYFLTPSI